MKYPSIHALRMLAFLAVVLRIAAPADAQRPRSAYAPARRPMFARRIELEKLVRSSADSVPDESSRRPPTLSLLEKLANGRARLQSEFAASETWNGPGSARASRHIQGIQSLLEASQDERRKQMDQMNVMLERLETMIIVEPTARVANATKTLQPNIDSFHDNQSSEHVADDAPSDETPVDATGRAVDRLRLADSLFGSEKFELARDIYLKLHELPSHANDRVWIEYQVASCHRNLADTSNAQKFYRYVVGSQDDTLAGYARWWLQAMQEKQDADRALNQISHSITETGQANHGDN